MENCIFCKIVKGEIPAEKVYEDDYTFAFLDINPGNPGHTLIIPKEHTENLYTISDEVLCRVMISTRKVALAVKHGMDADGIHLVVNNEKPAGQIIFHFHIHIVPRFVEDDFKWGVHKSYKESEIKEIAEKIKKELINS